MTLEEAIVHCEEKACGNTQCALEHRQLAEWLQELRQYRKNARKKEYIDAEKLKAEIEERLHCNGSFDECGDTAWDYDQGMVAAYNYVLSFIDTLQQEQPEVDLDNKIEKYLRGWVARDKDGRLWFYTDKPWKHDGKSWEVPEGEYMEIDKTWYPNVKWEDEEPTETAFTTIDESELTHGKVVKMEEALDDRAYCKEHCKGYRESGGKCFFDDDCEEKKEAGRVNTWVPKFKKGDYITDMSTIYLVRKVDEDGYWCAMCDDDCNPKVGKVWCDSRVEKDLKLYKREPETKQTIEISSTKEAEEIINFIKDCFNRCRIAFPGADWEYYEKAIEILRPEYTSYQQGFNAGHKEGYEARKKEEKKLLNDIRAWVDELKDTNIDEDDC